MAGTTFDQALIALRNGLAISRIGWNGKGMFVYLVPSAEYEASTDIAKAYFGGKVPYGAYLAMKTAQGNVVPWLASQRDILADDWKSFQVVCENFLHGFEKEA